MEDMCVIAEQGRTYDDTELVANFEGCQNLIYTSKYCKFCAQIRNGCLNWIRFDSLFFGIKYIIMTI